MQEEDQHINSEDQRSQAARAWTGPQEERYPESDHETPFGPEQAANPMKRPGWNLLLPGPGRIVTPILFYLNSMVYLVMVIMGTDAFSPSVEDLLNWGALTAYYVFDGEVWRMLTCTFLHGGLIHLAMNMYALLILGYVIEPLIGSGRFTAAYLISGIGGSLLSMMSNPMAVSVGASGAIFGLMGLLLVLMLGKRIRAENPNMLRTLFIIVGLNLLIGFTIPRIDNAGHIGGLLGGAVSALALFPLGRLNGRRRSSRNLIALAVLLISGIALLLRAYSPSEDAREIQSKGDLFDEQHLEADVLLERARLAQMDISDLAISEIEVAGYFDEAFSFWQANEELMAEMALDSNHEFQSLAAALAKQSRLEAELVALKRTQFEQKNRQTSPPDSQAQLSFKEREIQINQAIDEILQLHKGSWTSIEYSPQYRDRLMALTKAGE